MLFNKGGRHYWFAKYLKREGYEPAIFCCNVKHGAFENYIDTGALWTEKMAEDIDVPFIYVKSSLYKGNGKDRVINMIRFYRNVQKAAKEYAKTHAKPDVIYASSVHPLTLVAGIKLAKYFGINCICEVRDLWPEELIDMKVLKKSSIASTILYKMEYWIYKRAHSIVFTMEGGKQYIIDRGWAGKNKVDVKKIHYINNGVSLHEYKNNLCTNQLDDEDLNGDSTFKVVYTGSIRQANGIDRILAIAKKITEPNIKFLLWGAGNYVETLKKQVMENGLDNVVYKGFINKQYIPYVLSRSDLNILNYLNADIFKYGCSNNKLFEYLASGRPILSTIRMNYSILKQFNCGVEVETVDESLEQILRIYKMSDDEKQKLIANTAIAANEFDFKNLTKKLVSVIEEV